VEYLLEDIRYVETAFNRFYDVGAADSGGVSRLGYTKEEDEMHAIFSELGHEQGMEICSDLVGNTFASNGGSSDDYYLIGSHLDSVVDGGRYDGVAGILAGLLVARWIKRDGVNVPIRVAAFRCEESSNFGFSCLGSAMAVKGGMGVEATTLAGRDGKTVGEIFAERGYSLKPERISGDA